MLLKIVIIAKKIRKRSQKNFLITRQNIKLASFSKTRWSRFHDFQTMKHEIKNNWWILNSLLNYELRISLRERWQLIFKKNAKYNILISNNKQNEFIIIKREIAKSWNYNYNFSKVEIVAINAQNNDETQTSRNKMNTSIVFFFNSHSHIIVKQDEHVSFLKTKSYLHEKKRKRKNIYILSLARKTKLIKKSHCNTCIHYFSWEKITKLIENATTSTSHREKITQWFWESNFKKEKQLSYHIKTSNLIKFH